jgi:hypothetical protein
MHMEVFIDATVARLAACDDSAAYARASAIARISRKENKTRSH